MQRCHPLNFFNSTSFHLRQNVRRVVVSGTSQHSFRARALPVCFGRGWQVASGKTGPQGALRGPPPVSSGPAPVQPSSHRRRHLSLPGHALRRLAFHPPPSTGMSVSLPYLGLILPEAASHIDIALGAANSGQFKPLVRSPLSTVTICGELFLLFLGNLSLFVKDIQRLAKF